MSWSAKFSHQPNEIKAKLSGNAQNILIAAYMFICVCDWGWMDVVRVKGGGWRRGNNVKQN